MDAPFGLMLIHLDTSVLVDAFTGPRRSLPQVTAATAAGDVLAFCAIVAYEWLRGARAETDAAAVMRVFETRTIVPFSHTEADLAASLYTRVPRARQRHADLAIAACAIERGARLWTLNVRDFKDIPGLELYRAPD